MSWVAKAVAAASATPAKPSLTEAQRGVLLSTMGDASCGMTLGRSVAWVVRMRRELAGQLKSANASDAVSRCLSGDAAHRRAVPAPLTIATEVAPAPEPGARRRSPEPGARSPEPGGATATRSGQRRMSRGGGMTPKPVATLVPDAATLRRAIEAACALKSLGVALAEGQTTAARTVRILAGAALKARFGTPGTVLAERLDVHATELAPSMLAKRDITTDDLLEVIEGMGPCEAPAAEAVPVEASPAAMPAALNPAAPPPFVPRERKAPKASAPRAVVLPPRPQPAPDRPVPSLPAPRFPSERPRPRPAPSAAVVRLKPVTADIVRWARAFLASPLWTLDEVSDLFGVHPDALADGVAA